MREVIIPIVVALLTITFLVVAITVGKAVMDYGFLEFLHYEIGAERVLWLIAALTAALFSVRIIRAVTGR